MASFHDFTATTLEGRPQPLSDYRGQVLLVVNVASRCGFTPQYAGLERLWRRWRDRGFAVLGFPCDQFGRQEPGGAEEIRRSIPANRRRTGNSSSPASSASCSRPRPKSSTLLPNC